MTRPIDADRLTDADRTTIRARLAQTVADWTGPRETGIDTEALVRIGANAIGCTLYDLRPVEVAWLRAEAAAAYAERP
jgi:hypothetical protein